jgi:hypothetical protein
MAALVEVHDVGWPHWRADDQLVRPLDNQGLAEGVDLIPRVMLGELAAHEVTGYP